MSEISFSRLRAQNEALVRAFHKAHGTTWFRVVPAALVDAGKREVAGAQCALAALELKVSPVPRIVWFRELPTKEAPRVAPAEAPSGRTWSDEPVRGRATAIGAIFVRSDQTIPEIVETTAHELKHVEQLARAQKDERWRDYYTGNAGSERMEDEALRYGRKWREFFEGPNAFHEHDGFPYNFVTLEGIAEQGDLLIARAADGERALYKNLGSKSRPEWMRL